MSSRRSALKQFPTSKGKEQVVVLTVGQAIEVLGAFQQFHAAQQQLNALAQKIGFDPNSDYRIEDDGRLIRVEQPEVVE
jgi:hypothetical protein